MNGMHFVSSMDIVGNAIDIFGVFIMIAGIVGATVWFFVLMQREGAAQAYTGYRQTVGRSILLGLEFLVAGDIIRTVAVSPSLMNVTVLAGIVLIRTFLSFALQLEVEGRWPWQTTSEKTGS